MWKAVLFDYDDTLVDTLGSRSLALTTFFRTNYGINITQAEIEAVWGIQFSQMMTALGKGASVRVEDYLKVAKDFPIKPFEGVAPLLQSLHKRVPIGIVTSVAREVLLADIQEMGWSEDWFAVISAQEDTPAHKPDADVFIPAMNALRSCDSQITPDKVLYVGNALSDGLAARAAGLGFLGVPTTHHERNELAQHGFSVSDSIQDLAMKIQLSERQS